MQFGYNCDFIGYFPMPGAANPSHHGLLAVNLEYTNEELMFPGLRAAGRQGRDVRRHDAGAGRHRDGRAWRRGDRGPARERQVAGRRNGSKYGRRIDATTPMEITGPAAGHARLQTSADPSGRRALGMFNNCAGGVTPWGTWLTCEENFHGYFTGKLPDGHPEARNHRRYGVPGDSYAWGKFHDRFNITKEPNEPNRFGWVVEIDPFDPTSTPKKRTALGRAKHEGAAGIINKDGRYVIYSGDDERFDYVYRFVTTARVDRANPQANRDILDDGVLSVARYNADGTVDWLPLVHGQGPLTAANGFASQADVLIEMRRAADLLGATKMDRPEDVEANPVTQKVYVILTNNGNRKPEQVDAANPRAANQFGHIIEMIPPGGDHAAAQFRWEMLLKCGDPSIAAVGATYSADTTRNGWFGMPDNLAIDSQGRLWIATDGNSKKRHRPRRRLVGRRDRRARCAAPRGTSIASRSAPNCAVPASRPTTRRCSSPSSIRAKRSPSGEPSSFEEPIDALARLQARHAAAPVGGRHHQARRRQDRVLVARCRIARPMFARRAPRSTLLAKQVPACAADEAERFPQVLSISIVFAARARYVHSEICAAGLFLARSA